MGYDTLTTGGNEPGSKGRSASPPGGTSEALRALVGPSVEGTPARGP